VPDGKSTGDKFVGNPSSHGHHSNTSVFDLLHSEALHLVAFHILTLGESKRIVSVVSRDGAFLVPLTFVGDALEPSGNKEDLEESSGRNVLDSIKRGHSGEVGEGGSVSGGKKPSLVGFGVEGVGSSGSKVKGEVNSELLVQETDGGNHSNTSVLDLGVLEPLDGRRLGILKDPGAKRGALVTGLDGNTEFGVKAGHDGNITLGVNTSGCESGSSSKDGDKSGNDLHG